MTDYERALLRLEAWKALKGWGHIVDEVKIGDRKMPISEGLGFAERCQMADDLFRWMVEQNP